MLQVCRLYVFVGLRRIIMLFGVGYLVIIGLVLPLCYNTLRGCYLFEKNIGKKVKEGESTLKLIDIVYSLGVAIKVKYFKITAIVSVFKNIILLLSNTQKKMFKKIKKFYVGGEDKNNIGYMIKESDNIVYARGTMKVQMSEMVMFEIEGEKLYGIVNYLENKGITWYVDICLLISSFFYVFCILYFDIKKMGSVSNFMKSDALLHPEGLFSIFKKIRKQTLPIKRHYAFLADAKHINDADFIKLIRVLFPQLKEAKSGVIQNIFSHKMKFDFDEVNKIIKITNYTTSSKEINGTKPVKIEDVIVVKKGHEVPLYYSHELLDSICINNEETVEKIADLIGLYTRDAKKMSSGVTNEEILAKTNKLMEESGIKMYNKEMQTKEEFVLALIVVLKGMKEYIDITKGLG